MSEDTMTNSERILRLEIIRAKHAMNPSRYDGELLDAIKDAEKAQGTK